MTADEKNGLAYELEPWEEIEALYNPEPAACAWDGEISPETGVLAIHKETDVPGVYQPHRFLTAAHLTGVLADAGIITPEDAGTLEPGTWSRERIYQGSDGR